jgi:hypothetical protein
MLAFYEEHRTPSGLIAFSTAWTQARGWIRFTSESTPNASCPKRQRPMSVVYREDAADLAAIMRGARYDCI